MSEKAFFSNMLTYRERLDFIFKLILPLNLYFMNARSGGSDETAHMRRPARVLPARRSAKHQSFICWPIFSHSVHVVMCRIRKRVVTLLALFLGCMLFMYMEQSRLLKRTVLKRNNRTFSNTELSSDSRFTLMVNEKSDKSISAHDDMDLYVRTTGRSPILRVFYNNVLVQSMRYFWPDISSMVVVLDQEKPDDHKYGDTIRNTFPFPRICYMANLTLPGYSGKDRMQRDLFYANQCTSKRYVAFVDTDALFITRVIPEMLFKDDKPIIIAIYGLDFRADWSRSTAGIFMSKDVMRCMSYFPVVIKVEHLVQMRAYLENLHNISFDEILQKWNAARFAQFNLMCQYLWMFHRSEYDFRFQLQRNRSPLLNRVDPKIVDNMTTEEQRSPIARVSVHYKYFSFAWKEQDTYRDIFRKSVCFAGGFELCSDKCKLYNKSSLRIEMFEFDRFKWTWDKRCKDAQDRHYKEVAGYYSLEYSEIIRNACSEVDTLTLPLPDNN